MANSTPRHRGPVSFCVKSAIWIPVATAALFATIPAAKTEATKTETTKTETEGAGAPNPDNVLVLRERPGEIFSRWMGMPTAAAATRISRRPQSVRNVKAKKRTDPAAPQQRPEPQAVPPAWPSAATAGSAALVPITVKTVREMVAPPSNTSLVFENELSDIDLAARPAVPAPVPASTDGRGNADPEEINAAEQPRFFAMAETMKTITQSASQSAWLEPLLLALAGALAALTAMRVFARS